jgi:hypothetical protein
VTEFKSFVKRTIYVVLPVILFTVYCIPIQADVIPIKDLERAELILYGTISDSAILQRVDTLETALFGEKTKESIIARAQRVASAVFDNENGLSLQLLVNIMEWTLFSEIKQGCLIERVDNLEMNVYGEVKYDGLMKRVETMASLLVPLDILEADYVQIPKGEEIHIKLLEEINTAVIKKGVLIDFVIEKNYKIDGYLVIPAGTRGTLQVTDLERAGNFGKDASITLKINDIQAFDTTTIPLNLKLDKENNSKEIALGVGLLGTIIVSNPVGFVASYFLKGKEIVIPSGTVIRTQVMEDVEVYTVKMM